MRINNNLMAMNTHRQLGVTNLNGGKSMEKLSSGLRINRAGDDAAGLAISEKMRGQIRGLTQASRNAQDGISLIQTAEGALQETHAILQRMNELAVQAASGTLSDNDRTAIGSELTKLNDEIDRISTSTKFNGQKLLDGTFGVQLGAGSLAVGTDGVTAIDISNADASRTYTLANGTSGEVTLTDDLGNVQKLTGLGASYTGTLDFDKLGVKISGTALDTDGASALSTKTIITTGSAAVKIQIGSENIGSQQLGITIDKVDSTSLSTGSISVATADDAQSAITTIQSAIDTVSLKRSDLGAYQNRLEHTIKNLDTTAENLQASESRIRDVDMAKEMMEFTKNNILQQAAQAMLAQANQAPQGVLQLLR